MVSVKSTFDADLSRRSGPVDVLDYSALCSDVLWKETKETELTDGHLLYHIPDDANSNICRPTVRLYVRAGTE